MGVRERTGYIGGKRTMENHWYERVVGIYE